MNTYYIEVGLNSFKGLNTMDDYEKEYQSLYNISREPGVCVLDVFINYENPRLARLRDMEKIMHLNVKYSRNPLCCRKFCLTYPC